MTQQEFAQFVMALKTYYPRETLLPNNQAVELWYRQLCDIDYQTAEIALNKWVATNKWSPSIADIRETALDVKEGEAADWGTSWERVLHAIRYYGSYEQQKALDSLDDITRQCVKQLGWNNLCMSENITTDRANFRMVYERAVQRRRQDAQIPAQLRQLIGQMQIGMIEGGDSE